MRLTQLAGTAWLVFSLATLSVGCGSADPANDQTSDATNGALQGPAQGDHRSTRTVQLIPRQPDTKGQNSADVVGSCGTFKLELTTHRARGRILLLAELYVTPTKPGLLTGPFIDPALLPYVQISLLKNERPFATAPFDMAAGLFFGVTFSNSPRYWYAESGWREIRDDMVLAGNLLLRKPRHTIVK